MITTLITVAILIIVTHMQMDTTHKTHAQRKLEMNKKKNLPEGTVEVTAWWNR